jgi:hypothetical protein
MPDIPGKATSANSKWAVPVELHRGLADSRCQKRANSVLCIEIVLQNLVFVCDDFEAKRRISCTFTLRRVSFGPSSVRSKIKRMPKKGSWPTAHEKTNVRGPSAILTRLDRVVDEQNWPLLMLTKLNIATPLVDLIVPWLGLPKRASVD